MRQSMRWLLESVGLLCEVYANAEEFLAAYDPQRPGCLVLDIRMPGLGGLGLQERLLGQGVSLPIIFVTAHGEVASAIRAMKGGAIDYLEKPFSDQVLVDRVREALDLDQRLRRQRKQQTETARRLAHLSPRQRQVMDMIVEGKSNKVIAGQLGIREKTVEVHRAQLMRKLGVSNVAALVHVVVENRADRGKPVGPYRKVPS